MTESAHWVTLENGIELLDASFEHHVYERHIHDTYAIGVTLHGVQRFSCRGAIRNSTPGHIAAIAPGDAHDGQSGSAGGYRYRMMYVPAAILRDVFEDVLERPALETYADSPVVNDPALADLLNTTWKAMAARALLGGEELFHRTIIALATRHSGLRIPCAPVSAPAVHRVRDYLHAHIDRAVSVRELASIASMSRFQLTRQFQRAFGLPLHAYHLHARLEEAKRRLGLGAPIVDVAADLGFADQSHFHRRFKGWFGITPKEWQAAHKHPRPAIGTGATLRP